MDLGDFVCGGYAIIKSYPRPDWLGEGLLPETILSASRCFCEAFPNSDFMSRGAPENILRKAAATFGIDAEQIAALLDWSEQRSHSGEIVWPYWFASLHTGREFAERFSPAAEGLHLIGIAIHSSLAPPVVQALFKPVQPFGDFPPIAPPTTSETIERAEPLAPGGESLGFEVLGMDCDPFHSWLCGSLHGPVAEVLGIRPNAAGFIETADDAQAVADYCNRDDVPSEPVFWVPWAIVEYPMA